jgi:hypothetical protein
MLSFAFSDSSDFSVALTTLYVRSYTSGQIRAALVEHIEGMMEIPKANSVESYNRSIETIDSLTVRVTGSAALVSNFQQGLDDVRRWTYGIPDVVGDPRRSLAKTQAERQAIMDQQHDAGVESITPIIDRATTNDPAAVSTRKRIARL